MEVYVQKKHEDIEPPIFAHPGDAGLDLRAAEDVILKSGDWKVVNTGLFMAIPDGYVGLIHPRSGLALKHGITVLNAPGTIDSGYRGEIGVVLYNVSDIAFQVFRGDRIAQMVFQKFEKPTFVNVDSLNDSERGEGGFGSTGKE